MLEDEEGTPFGKFVLVGRRWADALSEDHVARLASPGDVQRLFLVKRLLGEQSNRYGFRESFLRASKVAALLTHPNIVQLHEFGQVGERYYQASELVDGLLLAALMKAATKRGLPMGPKVATLVGIQACEALHYAHELRSADGLWLELFHGSISPSALLVSRRGVVKVSEYGSTHISHHNAAEVAVIRGSAAYLSPEQASSRPTDHRTDIFSLGVILYELAVERRLFKKDDAMLSLQAIVRGDIPPPSEVSPNIPRGLEHILARALQRAPQDRYHTAEEMRSDLEALAASQGWGAGNRELGGLVQAILGKTPGLSRSNVSGADFPAVQEGRSDRPSRSNRFIWIAVLAAFAIAASAALWWTLT